MSQVVRAEMVRARPLRRCSQHITQTLWVLAPQLSIRSELVSDGALGCQRERHRPRLTELPNDMDAPILNVSCRVDAPALFKAQSGLEHERQKPLKPGRQHGANGHFVVRQ